MPPVEPDLAPTGTARAVVPVGGGPCRPGALIPPGHDRARGGALVELLVVASLVGILCLLSAPALAEWAAARSLRAAVIELRVAVVGVRAAAAAGRARGIVFESVGSDLRWSVVADGDGDGIRTADRRAGTDPRVLGPVDVGARHPGVAGGLPAGAEPLGASPGAGGVALGRSRTIACRADGGCSSGTVYLRGAGGRGMALQLYGPTGRVRLREWRPDGDGWRSVG